MASLALTGALIGVLDGSALAQPADRPADVAEPDSGGARPPQRIGYGALPGGIHVAAAETPPVGTVELALLSGFGYRKGLLSADHTLDRAIGDIAISYAPLANLAIALSFDGRYDHHKLAGTTDDGYVGDPHLLVRFAAPSGRLALGGQLGIWVPGKNAPSIAASATSVDALGLLSIDAGFGLVTANAGFRLDNSAKSIDKPMALSVEDQVSLGVSSFSAALAGLSLRVPINERMYVALEGSADVFVGSGAPGPIVRGGGLFGVTINDALSLIAYLEGAKVPAISASDVTTNQIVLVPYEPVITGGIGLQVRFGGPRPVVAPTSQITRNARPVPVTVVETADVTGTVVDDAGKPVVGARITIKLKNNTATAISDDKGTYVVTRLPIGKTVDGKTDLDDTGAEISAEVANKKPGSATLTLARGANTVPRIALDPMLPPGQLRGGIINVGTSRPVAGATVTIEPGDVTTTSGPDGKFSMDLPPGHYRITVTARGLAQQQLDVNIDPNGVAIKNIELHK
jgi:hypothetical protein